MSVNDLTTNEVAARLKVSPITVRVWCRRGLFPNAYEKATHLARGSYWLIPESDLKGFQPPKMGRPLKKAGKQSSKK